MRLLLYTAFCWKVSPLASVQPRTGGRAGGRIFRDSKMARPSFSSAAAEVMREFAVGTFIGAGGSTFATLWYTSFVQQPAHAWITPAMCFVGATSSSLPFGFVASLTKARALIVESGAVRDATSRAWSAVFTDANDVALADGFEKLLNSSVLASTLVNDFVKGAGPFGTPARFLASACLPSLDAALVRIEAETSAQYGRRRWTYEKSKDGKSIAMRRRVEPILASAAEGIVVRFFDDNAALLAFATIVIASMAEGTFLVLDGLLPL